MICFLWCYNAKFNSKVLQTVSSNFIFPERNWWREISLPVNLLMANNLTLKPYSEQGIESAFVGKWEKQFFKRIASTVKCETYFCKCVKLCKAACALWCLASRGISVAAPELGLSSSAGCTKTSAPGGEPGQLLWEGHALNPICSGGFWPLNQGFRASPYQIIIHSPKPPHGPLFHPLPRESNLDYVFSSTLHFPACPNPCLSPLLPLPFCH